MAKSSAKSSANEFKFEIVKELGPLSAKGEGWTKEVNLVSWNGQEAKIDIRDWNDDHTKMSRGITLSIEEANKLVDLVQKNNNSK